jgi:hypothetical protein
LKRYGVRKTRQGERGGRNALGARAARAILAAGVGLALSACAQSASLTPVNQVIMASSVQNNVSVNFCTDPSYVPVQVVKTVIVLDHSGSNQNNYLMASDGSGAPALVGGTPVIGTQYATDPTGSLRYGSVSTPGSLLNYLNGLPANNPLAPTHYFALVDFSDTATTYPAGAAGFTDDIAAFYSYVQTDSGNGKPNDDGATNYLGALSAVYSIIGGDIQAAQKCGTLAVGSASPGSWCPTPGVQVASSYVIVFMSDGSPIMDSGLAETSGGQVIVTGPTVRQSAADIIAQVGAIEALASNDSYVSGVNLFTVYYYRPGNVDQNGETLLANMAKVGAGVGYNALSGSTVNYGEFQPPQKLIKYQLADVFVTNASASWWNDGTLHKDTDGDGLPDDVEVAFGTDPTNPSTDGNGVSDLVKYVLAQGVCSSKNALGMCADPIVDYRAAQCQGINTTALGAGYTFASSDPDGLNDCEKALLGDSAGIDQPDSNNDLISDFLEFRNLLPFQAGVAPAVNSIAQDGYSAYQKIKLSLPVTVPAGEVLNLQPATYNMSLLSASESQDCYLIQVGNLPTKSATDVVRVDVIEKSALLKTKILYRLGAKAFSANSDSLSFNDWTDPAELAAGTWKTWQQ